MTIFPSLRNFGGFFSDYYFTTVFSRSVAGRQKTVTNAQTDLAFRIYKRLRERAESRSHDVGEVRDGFARPLLRDAFGYYVGISDSHIYPLFASAEEEAASAPPLLLAYLGNWDEELDKGTKGKPSPMKQLRDALASNKYAIRYGVLLTAETLRLVRAGGDGPRNAYLQLDLEECLDREDRESFAAAWRIFASANFVLLPDGKLPIDAIEGESRDYAQRVSDDLKSAVFASAETLVQGLLEDWQAREPATRELGKLSAAALAAFRDAALTCLYRLLFVLYAEARDEHLLGHPLYRDSYSLAGLLRELVRGRDSPSGNRYGYWKRLLAMFAIHYGGLPTSGGLDPIPPRGGSLLDPRTEPGTILEEARLDDAAVARLILQLTTTRPRRGVGLERVSFRELDIEQLGAVYEGLLEYEPKVAAETMLEVKIQGKTYALKVPELVRLCDEKDVAVRGDPSLVEGTDKARLHSDASVSIEQADVDDEESELSGGDGEQEESDSGVKKGAPATLLRRLEPGTFHFVPGSARKGSGSFYTPLPLVQDLVRHALGPLLEGKTASEIERLRVLDPACGSAHFLVEVMRFLGRALHRAYSKEHKGNAPPHFRGTWDNDCEVSDQEARTSGSEARAWCKRRIAERCLYGVDLNPTAVQLAQVSLWIESLAGDRPLSYFAHHVRCGNSLLGTSLERLGQAPHPDVKPKPRPGELDIFAHDVGQRILEAAKLRSYIDLAADLGAVQRESIEEQKYKADRQREAEALLASAQLLFDLRSASAFVPRIWDDWPTLCSFISDAAALEAYAQARPWWDAFKQVRERERFFHWELGFPEVFLDGKTGGFDCVLSNPPWDKIKAEKKEFFGRFDVLIRAYVGKELDRRIRELYMEQPAVETTYRAAVERMRRLGQVLKAGGDYSFNDWMSNGHVHSGREQDVFKYFAERAWQLTRGGGTAGLLVPGGMYFNDGSTGLRHLLLERARIRRFYAFENRQDDGSKVFPIHPSFKFVDVVFEKQAAAGDSFPAAFLRRDLNELTLEAVPPWVVQLQSREIQRFSPDTFSFLEFRNRQDQQLVRRIYDASLPVGKFSESYGISVAQELNLAGANDLWTDDKTGKTFTPKSVAVGEPERLSDLMDAMAAKGYWPLFQDAHVHQHVVGFKPLFRWVSLERWRTIRGDRPTYGSRVFFRHPCRNTDERTCIAAIVPSRVFAADTLHGFEGREEVIRSLCALMDSVAFDYVVRLRVGGQNMRHFQMAEMPFPTLNNLLLIPAAPTIAANQRQDYVWDHPELWPALVEVEFAVCRAYGLMPDDLSHMLSIFQLFARKRSPFFAYLTSQIDAWRAGGSAHEPEAGPVLAGKS